VQLLKWKRLLRSAGLTDPSRDAARSLFGGFALGVVAPGRLGELGRCLFVADRDRAPVPLLTALDRALDFWALLTLAVVSLLVVIPRPVGVFAVGVWLVCVPILVGLPKLVPGVGGLPWWPESLRTRLRTAGQALLTIPPIGFAALSLLSTALDLLTFFLALRALHAVDFTAVLAIFPWIVLVGGLPVSMSGPGAREGTAVLLLADWAVPAAVVAMDASLLYFRADGTPACSPGICAFRDRALSTAAAQLGRSGHAGVSLPTKELTVHDRQSTVFSSNFVACWLCGRSTVDCQR
jgi:hypothetical protein